MKKYQPVWLNTHFNTSIEMTEESVEACEKLVNAGVPVGNQAVVLAGINDSIPIMKKLMHDLVKIRVRPYYIYQCDLSEGIGHFRAPVSKGLEIIEGLRGHTSGYAVIPLSLTHKAEEVKSPCSQTMYCHKVLTK